MALQNGDLSGLDFQASDDAWYGVRLVLQGETLVVKYCNFSEEFDEIFRTADFMDSKKLGDFVKRFRPTSIQLQDNECKKVIEGKTVCASYEFGTDDVRFYDAIVEEVTYKDHILGKEEACTCKFVLFWLDGPNAGTKTDSVVSQICLLQPGSAQIDKTLSRFQEICRSKNKVASQYSDHVSEGASSASHNSPVGSIVDNKAEPPRFEPHARCKKEVKTCKSSVSTSRKLKRQKTDHWEWSAGQYIDLEEDSDCMEVFTETPGFHFMLIDNLDKDSSSLAIVNFVKKHLDVTCQAQVFPSLSLESYTRGIIIVDAKEKLQKLSDFLCNDAYMILSSSGRPWVITEKQFFRGAVGANVRNLIMLPESGISDKSLEIGEKIRIVRRGTEEYNKGKQLKDIFLKYTDNRNRLHKRLAIEEKNILQ